MIDREKVIKGLEVHTGKLHLCKDGCPYFNEDGSRCKDLYKDALALLKEQEAEPEIEGGGSTWWYVCSECHGAIDRDDLFCKHCGAKMKRLVKLE